MRKLRSAHIMGGLLSFARTGGETVRSWASQKNKGCEMVSRVGIPDPDLNEAHSRPSGFKCVFLAEATE